MNVTINMIWKGLARYAGTDGYIQLLNLDGSDWGASFSIGTVPSTGNLACSFSVDASFQGFIQLQDSGGTQWDIASVTPHLLAQTVDGQTVGTILKLAKAVLGGKATVSGNMDGTKTVVFKAADGVSVVAEITFDASGNRSSVAITP